MGKGNGISSFILGGLIGAGLGLLFAPRTGRETREYLSDKALEYWDHADEFYESGREFAADAYYAGRDMATEAYQTGRDMATEVYNTGRDMATEAYHSGRERASEVSDNVRTKIDEAREKLFEVVNRASEPVEEAPAPGDIKEAVEKAASEAHEEVAE